MLVRFKEYNWLTKDQATFFFLCTETQFEELTELINKGSTFCRYSMYILPENKISGIVEKMKPLKNKKFLGNLIKVPSHIGLLYKRGIVEMCKKERKKEYEY